MVAHPCGVCSRAVAKNHMAVECDSCNNWVHIKCNLLDKKDYAVFQNPNNEAETFICINCMAQNVPF